MRIVYKPVSVLYVPLCRGEGRKGTTMSERRNTLVCAFDQQSPRITAYDIHEWIHDTVCLGEEELAMIEIGGLRRHVYIKFRDATRMQELLTSTKGQG